MRVLLHILMVANMVPVLYMDSRIHYLYKPIAMDIHYRQYIRLAVLVCNQHMDFHRILRDTCKSAYDFVEYIQLVVSKHYHIHMDLHKQHFHMLYRQDNRCYFGIQLLGKFQMDFLCIRSNIYIRLYFQQHSIQHLIHMDCQPRTD